MTLAEALQNVDLESGRTYQLLVRNQLVQVRVVALDKMSLAMPIDDGDIAPENLPFNLPAPTSAKIVRASRSIFGYDRPFEITDNDLTAGDLD